MLFLIRKHMIKLLHSKEIIFWTLAFPIILGTLFNMAFGSIYEDSEKQKVFPIAVIEESDAPEDLSTLVQELGKKGDNQLYSITKVKDEKEAQKLLADEKIDGYYLVAKDPKLIVKKNGMNQSILKEVLDRYNRTVKVTTDVIMGNPSIAQDQAKMQELVKSVSDGAEYVREKKLGTGEGDPMLTYFYALIGMTCIYGSLMGVTLVLDLEGNQSPLGARRCVSPTHKLKILCADSIGSILIQIVEVIIVICFLVFILGVDFGNKLGFVFIASAVGCVAGVSMGTFLGAIVKGGNGIKTSVAIAVSMAFSFLSGLMVNSMPHIMEKYCPIVNRINPCTLLNNCFYDLNICNDIAGYWKNLASLTAVSVVFIMGAFLLLRRRKYASI